MHVSVIIDGKTYRMACDEGQEDHLRSLAERMDSAITTLKDGFGDVGDQRLAIMGGIMIADELVETQRQVLSLQAEITSLKDNRSAIVDRYQSTEETLERILHEMSERINGLTTKLDGTDPATTSHKPAAE